MNHIFKHLVKVLEKTQVLGLILGLIIPLARRQQPQLSPETSPPSSRAAHPLSSSPPDQIILGASPKHNMCLSKIRDNHTWPWQVSWDVAGSGEAFLAPAAGKAALGLTALTFVCFSVGHDMRRDQTENELEKAGIGKRWCLPTPLQQELPKVPVWEQPHPVPGKRFPSQTLYCPQKGLSCL